ncbi:gamma-glutamylcyclotransferase [Polaromonas sp.]|uniref:gamma-glutamylcyclotransferase n=1 Tax=Polaromonas sp. TaxID=1869339 RepID=UPI00356704B5
MKARRDNSEGRLYGYLWIDIGDQAGNRVPAVTYQVRRSLGARGKPRKKYMALIRDAARERRLPQSHIDYLDGIEVRK